MVFLVHINDSGELYELASERSERDTLRSAQLRIARCIYLYHNYNGNSHAIKVIISLLNFLGIRYHHCATFSVFPMVYNSYTMATSALSNDNCPLPRALPS